ncbi:hypothetical protein A3F29_00055 [Candidatus Roizmanbacteria bacterium RIFCSPHIGHO2_12_FULL_33_9]|uniref:Big-1 domain-containing protein n=1 Tax=Candidatus Roizmanbacteria bacterium RIFCSPHIGHO2_12_FULL_33_9 TaxID=1802045 RepID=A0A1F7HK98_9BACT|nr:MAG: hypothetical protein A3F29_00055 [Candidatus Roizmanbacteria bacterium RIFCSPHIGHO2_12_FULL_33_9]
MDKKLLSLVILFIATFIFFVAILFFNEPLSQLTRATEETQPSPETSLIFAWPLTVKADGTQSSQINVFIRNDKNKLITNKRVELRSSLGDIKNIIVSSDTNGKTTFELTSKVPGTADVTAVVEGIKIKNALTIKFVE